MAQCDAFACPVYVQSLNGIPFTSSTEYETPEMLGRIRHNTVPFRFHLPQKRPAKQKQDALGNRNIQEMSSLEMLYDT